MSEYPNFIYVDTDTPASDLVNYFDKWYDTDIVYVNMKILQDPNTVFHLMQKNEIAKPTKNQINRLYEQ